MKIKELFELASAYKHPDYLCMIDECRLGDKSGECGIKSIHYFDGWIEIHIIGRKKYYVPSNMSSDIASRGIILGQNLGIKTKPNGKGFISTYELKRGYPIAEKNLLKMVDFVLDKVYEDASKKRECIEQIQRIFLSKVQLNGRSKKSKRIS